MSAQERTRARLEELVRRFVLRLKTALTELVLGRTLGPIGKGLSVRPKLFLSLLGKVD